MQKAAIKMNRQDILSSLKENPEVSVLIVGAGINGIGLFRDLALNGVDVLLIDRSDFCAGASAASSHMAHGGIRYLENGEFRLVREAVRERNRMLQNAPHLVKPLATTIPIFKWFSGLWNAPLKFLGWLDRPSERGSVVIKIGLLFYDAYTGLKREVPFHRFRDRKTSLKKWPLLNPQVVHTATYYDGAILSPERYGLELVLDAEGEGVHARALNYVSLEKGSERAVTLRDELDGSAVQVNPKILVNAAGPWIDFANRSLGLSTHYIGGTKGSHLVLDHSRLREAIGPHEFFFENNDGRIVLIFPLFDKVLIGTTDISIEDPDSAICTEEEIDYFLDMIDRVFPNIEVARDHIVYRFCGVRPLPYSSARTTGQISRDHSVQVTEGVWTGLEFPVYSLVGGKWTSYRAFSEETTDKVLKTLGLERQKDTRATPVGGGRAYPKTDAERDRLIEGYSAWTGMSTDQVKILFGRYGTRSEEFCSYIVKEVDQPLKTLPDYSRREIEFLARFEKVSHLDDLLLRRTMLAMLGHITRKSVEELLDVLGDTLKWNRRKRNAELTRTLDLLEKKHGLRI